MNRLLPSLLLFAMLAMLLLLSLGRFTPTADAAPASQRRGAEDTDTFSPTEELPADSRISFPVDI